ncbi:MAG: hypothetical protein LBT00_02650, partial [Spirochaetaceae bacterium]|nr:hypothetical protein [Spirochaetaceae bacterium]
SRCLLYCFVANGNYVAAVSQRRNGGSRHCEGVARSNPAGGIPVWVASPLTATMLPPSRNDDPKRCLTPYLKE